MRSDEGCPASSSESSHSSLKKVSWSIRSLSLSFEVACLFLLRLKNGTNFRLQRERVSESLLEERRRKKEKGALPWRRLSSVLSQERSTLFKRFTDRFARRTDGLTVLSLPSPVSPGSHCEGGGGRERRRD